MTLQHVPAHVRAPAPEDLASLLSLFQHARHAEAERLARALTTRFPRHPLAFKLFAAALSAQGRTRDAIRVYQRAAPLLANDPEFHNNYANALQSSGRSAEAESHYRRALALSPSYAEAHENLALLLHALDRLDEAESSLRHALALRPGSASIHRNLANLLHAAGRLLEAETAYRQSLALAADHPETLHNLATLELKLGRLAEARDNYTRAIALAPANAEAHANLGLLYKSTGDLAAAEASLRRALALASSHPAATNTLAILLQESAQLDEAEALLRAALHSPHASAQSHSNLLFLLQHKPHQDPAALFAEHRAFSEKWERPLRRHWPRHTNSRDPNRPLRVGFVSGDLRDHPLERYLLPILELLRDDPSFILHAYSTSFLEDARTAHYRASCSHWNSVAHLSDSALTAHIQRDTIDILIDLSGHTGANRLLAFARRPAPIQITWLGYVGTTGLDAMDYCIADAHLVPPALHAFFSEKILTLPATSPFRPYPASPLINPLPALTNPHFTFASFNRLGKLNREVIALWAQILHAVPASRLVLAAIPAGPHAERVSMWLAEHCIPPARIAFLPARTLDETLLLHHHVDLCLDTFPYNGSTTNNHALWMGVPTLTLRGDAMPGRMGAALAAHTGLDNLAANVGLEKLAANLAVDPATNACLDNLVVDPAATFVAADASAYLRSAVYWARHREQLAALRPTLRPRFAASLLQQPDVIARALSASLRTAWQRWCSNLPPDSFSA